MRFFRDSIGLNLRPRFEVIGLSYLLSLDVSLGVWFFAFLSILHSGVERLLGWHWSWTALLDARYSKRRSHGPRCDVLLGIRQHLVGAPSPDRRY